MTSFTKSLAAVAIAAALAGTFSAQAVAHDEHLFTGNSQLLPIANEAAPRLTVEAPIASALARGVALIPYRVENLRILPVLGPAAESVSPRVGHLHITVDNLPWHWAQFSNDGTIVVAELPAGPHSVRIELAGPTHSVYTGQTVTFTVPAASAS